MRRLKEDILTRLKTSRETKFKVCLAASVGEEAIMVHIKKKSDLLTRYGILEILAADFGTTIEDLLEDQSTVA